jgi:hypothetical protein
VGKGKYGLGAVVIAVAGVVGTASQSSAAPDVVSWIRDYLKGRDELKITVQALDTAMQEAAQGRQKLLKLTKDVNNCHISPKDAVLEITSIQNDNRELVRLQIADVKASSNQDATALLRDFKHAMQTSYRADKQYRDWLVDWENAYPTASENNCLHPERTQEYVSFENLSATASIQKSAFAKRYNAAAKDYGLRHNWSEWTF